MSRANLYKSAVVSSYHFKCINLFCSYSQPWRMVILKQPDCKSHYNNRVNSTRPVGRSGTAKEELTKLRGDSIWRKRPSIMNSSGMFTLSSGGGGCFNLAKSSSDRRWDRYLRQRKLWMQLKCRRREYLTCNGILSLSHVCMRGYWCVCEGKGLRVWVYVYGQMGRWVSVCVYLLLHYLVGNFLTLIDDLLTFKHLITMELGSAPYPMM